MVYHRDLEEIPNFLGSTQVFLAVGWLERRDNIGNAVEFPTKQPTLMFLKHLESNARMINRLCVSGGYHECRFGKCNRFQENSSDAWQFERGFRFGDFTIGDSYNIVPIIAQCDAFYIAPNLLLHYVRDHHYSPPLEFVDAVVNFDPKSEICIETIKEIDGQVIESRIVVCQKH